METCESTIYKNKNGRIFHFPNEHKHTQNLQDRILFIYNAYFENQRENVRAVLKFIPFQKNV